MATPIPENRATVTSTAAAAATGGTLRRGASDAAREREHVGVTTDSRAVVSGGVFVALQGEVHDGHRFLDAAVAKGATLLVTLRGRAPVTPPHGVDVLEVDDTLVAWGDLARTHLAAWRASDPRRRVVAITGSVGKTTTKELTQALLSVVAPVRATDGNLNNRIGVPAMIFTLDASHTFAVLECGMSLRGEMAELARISRPDVAAVTVIGMAHAENLGGTREGVATEKVALFAGAAPHAALVVNADDELSLPRARRLASARSIVTFGRAASADVRLVERRSEGFAGERVTLARAPRRTAADVFDVLLPVMGEGAAIDLACAIAATEAAAGRRLTSEEIARALQTVRLSGGRANVQTRADGVVVVDDTYNANPQSMENALQSLAEVARREKKRAVCVLGEMKELGPTAGEAHDALGDRVADAGVSLFIGCGGLVDRALARAAARGVRTIGCVDASAAAALAEREVAPGDIVLVKGSRSVGAERVVAALFGHAAEVHA